MVLVFSQTYVPVKLVGKVFDVKNVWYYQDVFMDIVLIDLFSVFVMMKKDGQENIVINLFANKDVYMDHVPHQSNVCKFVYNLNLQNVFKLGSKIFCNLF